VLAVSLNPNVLPLCFPREVAAVGSATVEQNLNCPTQSNTTEPSGGDVLIVALLGLLGGALAASISIRNLKGTSTPYDVPVALAMLKVPLGAFTAILGLVAIQGDFVPGLSVLDSQGQILAYALIFGFAQQVFTRLLDQRAQTLLSGLPGDATTAPAPPTQPTVPPLPPPKEPGPDPAGGAATVPAGDTGELTNAKQDGQVEGNQPNPEGDEVGHVQDDGGSPRPGAPERDHR
jgi:hypothetical protein